MVVDYAHTPDALEKVVSHSDPSWRKAASSCACSAAADPRPGQAAQMGGVAAALAEVVVVTSDNPRSEDPSVIANAIVKGVRDAGRRWAIENDRHAAIAGAVTHARRDVVLIAGKGHELWSADAREARPPRRLEWGVINRTAAW